MAYKIADLSQTVINAGKIIKEGNAQAVKLEGGRQIVEEVAAIIEAGIPVMGHLGLTPQSVNQVGGFKVQAKTEGEADKLVADAKALEQAGVFALVLECIPAQLAKRVTDELTIPTIGIGAGKDCDGQVLVTQDMLGFNNDFSPKFVKEYADLAEEISAAIGRYKREVEQGEFPTTAESF
jgi:3-methyl-2-oxobutanoate hydroxymethyltransferase